MDQALAESEVEHQSLAQTYVSPHRGPDGRRRWAMTAEMGRGASGGAGGAGGALPQLTSVGYWLPLSMSLVALPGLGMVLISGRRRGGERAYLLRS